MANWKYTLDLKEDRKAFETDEIDLQELCKRIVNKIRALPCYKRDDELKDISTEFEIVESVSDFDNALDQLYDWGDVTIKEVDFFNDVKQCWVEFGF